MKLMILHAFVVLFVCLFVCLFQHASLLMERNPGLLAMGTSLYTDFKHCPAAPVFKKKRQTSLDYKLNGACRCATATRVSPNTEPCGTPLGATETAVFLLRLTLVSVKIEMTLEEKSRNNQKIIINLSN